MSVKKKACTNLTIHQSRPVSHATAYTTSRISLYVVFRSFWNSIKPTISFIVTQKKKLHWSFHIRVSLHNSKWTHHLLSLQAFTSSKQHCSPIYILTAQWTEISVENLWRLRGRLLFSLLTKIFYSSCHSFEWTGPQFIRQRSTNSDLHILRSDRQC